MRALDAGWESGSDRAATIQPDHARVRAATESSAKPRLRGRLHQAAFFAAIPAGVILLSAAQTAAARATAAIYVASLLGLYGTSGAYHVVPWSPRALRWMKRLDHSMIFVLIAGTTTPLSLLVMRPPWSVALVAVVWGGAAAGIALKMLRVDGFRIVGGTLYIALGWAVVLTAPQLISGLSFGALMLVVAGGMLYTGGAIVLLRRKPDPSPRTFGYHEVWHSMVILASACHYLAILLVLQSTPSPVA